MTIKQYYFILGIGSHPQASSAMSLLHLNNSLCVSCEQAISQRLHEIYLLNLDLPPKEFSGEGSFTSIALLSMLTP